MLGRDLRALWHNSWAGEMVQSLRGRLHSIAAQLPLQWTLALLVATTPLFIFIEHEAFLSVKTVSL